jgi:hypothetical protein
MQMTTGQTFQMVDAKQRVLGQVVLEDEKDGLIFGKFVPGPAFAETEWLFRKFEEAVDSQALGVVDELDSAIADLGLELRPLDESGRITVHDVQIWSDGDITFYLDTKTASPSRKTSRAGHAVAAISARSV